MCQYIEKHGSVYANINQSTYYQNIKIKYKKGTLHSFMRSFSEIALFRNA